MNPYSLKSISTTYPGFHTLPKAIKQMLLVTENFYFEEARPQQPEPAEQPEISEEILYLPNPGPYQAPPPQIRPGM